MKKIHEVNVIEVKRCFVISQLIKLQKGKKRYLGLLPQSDFERKLISAKKRALKFSEKQLDKIIADEYKKRLKAYNQCKWYIGSVSTSEVGVWKGAGGLPLAWTKGSLKYTAQKIKQALNTNPKLITKRARRAIPNMLQTNLSDFQEDKYLLPIIFKGGTGTNGRKGLKQKMKGDIDDGCMRSITLAIDGTQTIKAYVGLPKIAA